MVDVTAVASAGWGMDVRRRLRATRATPAAREARPRQTRFQARDAWDRIFEIGIIAKGLNGIVEVIGGLLLLILTPEQLRALAVSWTREELSEDPRDFLATHLLHTAGGLTGAAVLFGAAYLLIHGLVKIVLVAALLLNKLWAYPAMITVLLAFIGYQLYRIALHPSPGLVGLTVFDAAIVILTGREYRQQRRRRPAEAVDPSAEPGRPA